jgi:hypothetical protein
MTDAEMIDKMADEITVLTTDNRLLRELLWMRHGCVGLYGDDGEMQCSQCNLDFKRASPANIKNRFVNHGLAKLAADPRGVGAYVGVPPIVGQMSCPGGHPHPGTNCSRCVEAVAMQRAQAALTEKLAALRDDPRALDEMKASRDYLLDETKVLQDRLAASEGRRDVLQAALNGSAGHKEVAALRAERDTVREQNGGLRMALQREAAERSAMERRAYDAEGRIASADARAESYRLDLVKATDDEKQLQGAEAKLAAFGSLTQERDTAVRKREDMAKELTQALEKVILLRNQLSMVKTDVEGVWHWLGQNDRPESLACPVVMSAQTLRDILARPSAETLAVIRKGLHHTQDCLKGMSEGRLSADESFIDKTCACGLAAALAELNALEAK